MVPRQHYKKKFTTNSLVSFSVQGSYFYFIAGSIRLETQACPFTPECLQGNIRFKFRKYSYKHILHVLVDLIKPPQHNT